MEEVYNFQSYLDILRVMEEVEVGETCSMHRDC
jgi:hypothetical protein